MTDQTSSAWKPKPGTESLISALLVGMFLLGFLSGFLVERIFWCYGGHMQMVIAGFPWNQPHGAGRRRVRAAKRWLLQVLYKTPDIAHNSLH